MHVAPDGELRIEPAGEGDGEFRVEPGAAAVPASDESYRWSWWEQRGTDSLGVVFSTGFTGVSLRLARRGNDFEGSASAFFDFTSESPSATARLTRSACQ